MAKKPTARERRELEKEFADKNLDHVLFDIEDRYSRHPPDSKTNHRAAGNRSACKMLADRKKKGRIKAKTVGDYKKGAGYRGIIKAIYYIRNHMHETI